MAAVHRMDRRNNIRGQVNMAHYKQEMNGFLIRKALGFFLNFFRNMHPKSIIGDNDVFQIVCGGFSSGKMENLLKGFCSSRGLKIMEDSKQWGNERLDYTDEPTEILREAWNTRIERKAIFRVLKTLADRRGLDLPRNSRPDAMKARFEGLHRMFALSGIEANLLLLAKLLDNSMLSTPFGGRPSRATRIRFYAQCVDCSLVEARRALVADGKLRRYQLIDDDLDYNRDLDDYLNGLDDEPLTSHYFKADKGETLPMDFYGELAKNHGDVLKDIICAGKGASPVNILLYGAPGTGKTNFARTLAAELGRTCYFVAQCKEVANGKDDDAGATSSPAFRFGALQVCASQVNATRSLIVVDEADKMLGGETGVLSALFGGRRRSDGDKGRLNSALDTVKVPTIWITNSDAEDLDPSSRRRFDYSIRFEPLTATQRLSIWRNNVEKMKLGRLFTEAQLDTFAHRYGTNAGGITLTLQNIAKLRPAADRAAALVEKFMKPHCELMGVNVNDDRFAPAKDYSLDGLNVKGGLPLDRIVEAVRRYQEEDDQALDRPRMNLLLSGAPGTGKTEFVKYLGRVLDRKVSVRMGSDLLSMWVGGTEQNIKRVFREAEEEKSILFLDEIDGLVQTRERASKSWEVTQVNELLHQMEDFTGVMVGATNFAANLDPAILRRFTFKIEFGFLDTTGKRLFFERMFGTRLNDLEAARLALIPNLAPGDFRTVRQSLYYLGGDVTNAMRLEALAKEGRAKGVVPFGAGPAPVGFGA